MENHNFFTQGNNKAITGEVELVSFLLDKFNQENLI